LQPAFPEAFLISRYRHKSVRNGRPRLQRALCASIAAILLGFETCPVAAATEAGHVDRPGACAIGLYRLADGSNVDLGRSAGDDLRWRRTDGRTGRLRLGNDGIWRSSLGWTDKPDGNDVLLDCRRSRIRFGPISGIRVPLQVKESQFKSSDATLAGRLILPASTHPVPIVVLVHGSEHDSALEYNALQRLLPAMGIGAFVYDKRGTGSSTGSYSQDFQVLAKDAAAAALEARRLAGGRSGRIGFQGASQGGWVVPLAAAIEKVDFLVVSFGLAVSPADEEREAVAENLHRNGFGEAEVSEAERIAEASLNIIRSDFRTGFSDLDELRRRYQTEPWFRYVRGDVSHLFLNESEADLRKAGPSLFHGVVLDYDPLPALRGLETPQLWMLGGEDRDAPIGRTVQRLRELRQHGRPVTLAIFPKAEHGMYEFELAADGERLSTRQPQPYLRLMADFIRGAGACGHYSGVMLEPALGCGSEALSLSRPR